MWDDGYSLTYCDNHFMMHVSQLMLYILNLYSAVCQLYLNNTGRKNHCLREPVEGATWQERPLFVKSGPQSTANKKIRTSKSYTCKGLNYSNNLNDHFLLEPRDEDAASWHFDFSLMRPWAENLDKMCQTPSPQKLWDNTSVLLKLLRLW